MNLRLLQLGDSALPIGGYSHSWGLEAAIERGLVRDPAGLERWTRDWLRHSVAPAEGVVVAAVCRAGKAEDWDIIRRANELLGASLAPPTLRYASRDMGQQLLSLAAQWPWAQSCFAGNGQRATGNCGEWHHAVAFAILASAAGAVAGAVAAEAVAVYLHQAALGAIGAGVKAVPIGHTHGQQVLARLQPEIQILADSYAEAELDSAGSFCPAHEMLCHAQSHLYTRLFRS
jgi:urease accessory protein